MAARRPAPSKATKTAPPNGATLQYLTETLDLLELPESISPDLPPLDLHDWEDPDEDIDGIFEGLDDDTLLDSIEQSPKAITDQQPEVRELPPSNLPNGSVIEQSEELPAVLPAIKPETNSAASTPTPYTVLTVASPQEPLQELQESFNKEKLKRLVSAARDRGRKLKHAGDARMQSHISPSSEEIETALLESADSVLLYVFSFWCEDLLAGRLDENGKYTKPGCRFENWNTIFALLGFVRTRASKAQFTLLVSLFNLIEALVIRHMCVQERRNLHASMERQVSSTRQATTSSNSSSSNHEPAEANDTPQSSVATPPISGPASELISTPQARQSYDAFLRYSSNVEKATKLFAGSQEVLCISNLRKELPEFVQLCISTQTERRQVCEPRRPWQFAFALDTNGGYTALNHVVCFGRALLEHIARQKQLTFMAEWDLLE